MFNFWGISFHIYGLVLGLGILMAREVVIKVARERKLDENILDRIFIVSIVGGIIGARIYHVLDKWSYYSENLVKIFFVWEGGLGIWGGILGGAITTQFLILNFKFLSKVKFSEILDLGAIGLPLGQAIGRWGNYFNNEIVGKNGERLFLIESMANLLLFYFIYFLRNKYRGRLFGIYLVGYGLVRLTLENFRFASDQWLIGLVNIAMVLAVAAILAGIGIIWRKRI